MPVDEQHICEGCGLEFDENEIDAEGLCKECAKDFEEFNEDEDVVGDYDVDDIDEGSNE